MRLFIYIILFFLALFLPNLSLGTPPFLEIDLEIYPELNLLKGSLFTDNLNGEYKFKTSDFTINEVQTSSEILFEQEEFLKIFAKDESSLYISFEKALNLFLLPITIIHPPFPYPNKPFTYQIKLKIPDNLKNIEILIPSEESEIKRESNFLLYTFKTKTPLLDPCIIISTLKLEKIKFSYKNFIFHFYYFPQLYNLSEKDLKRFFENFKHFAQYLENLEIFPSSPKTFHIILVPEDFPKIQDFSNTLFINYSSLKDIKQFIHCLAKKEFEDEILLEEKEIKKGLITYLIDYQFSENKKDFRKLQALFPKNETKAFFYFLFLAEKMGEKNFINLFKKFYENHIFNFKSLKDFLAFIQQNYPELKNFIIPYEEFQKLSLRGEIKAITQEKDFYLINLTLYTNLNSKNLVTPIPIPLKIETERESEFLVLNLEKETQDFQISVNEKPKAIFIDPEYKLWRDLNFEEIPNCIAKLFYSQGTIILKRDDLSIYKKLIDYFRKLGYKVSFSFVDFSEISNFSENLIYLNISPLLWQFTPPSEGFYLKVLPNPYNSNYTIGYLYVSSQNELDWALKNLASLNFYSEIFIQSEKIISKKEDKTLEGIPIFIPAPLGESCIKENFSFREEALKLINSQMVLVGIEKDSPFCKDYFKNFLQSIYNLNTNIILALDLPPFFQKFLEDYFENKISESQFKENFKNIDYLNREVVLEIIDWAKMNKVKVFTIGTDSELFLKILNNGLKSLSQEELSKLPEIDILNPSYKKYLSSLFMASENLQKFNFENFYEAQVFRLEDLAEKIKKLLEIFNSNQFIIFIERDLIIKNWELPFYLQKRNILDFKIINFN